MLRKPFSWTLLALLAAGLSFALAQTEDQSAPAATATTATDSTTATATTSSNLETPNPDQARRDSETTFKKLPQVDPNIKVTKIHDFLNDDKAIKTGSNDALAYERDYWNFGAITTDQRLARTGHYFVISWVNKGPAANFTTRFEYRQSLSKNVVHSLTMAHTNIHGAARSTFGILGDAYKAYGPVVSWRFLVIKGDQIVGEEHSFIW